MNRDHLPPTPDDALLKRYREALDILKAELAG